MNDQNDDYTAFPDKRKSIKTEEEDAILTNSFPIFKLVIGLSNITYGYPAIYGAMGETL